MHWIDDKISWKECLFIIDTQSLINNTVVMLCLITPLTLVCGGSPIIPLLVHQPAYLSIWPAAPSLQQGLSTNPGGEQCGAYVGAVEEMVCVVCVLQRGHSGDGWT